MAPQPWGAYPAPVVVAAPSRGRGFASAIFTTLAVTVLGISLTLNFYFLVMAGLSWGGGLGQPIQTETIRTGQADRVVYRIDIDGVIDDALQERFTRHLKRALDDPKTKAVIVHVDSPGGAVTASDQIYQRLRRVREDKQLPVVVTHGGLAASGGYYVSAAGEHIIAHRTTLTGSIGVIMQRFNVAELMDRWGVRDATIKSSGSTFKDAGSMFRPETPEERAYFESLLNHAYDTFTQVVKEGRGDRLKAQLADVANGKVFTADEARSMGLVDDIGDLDTALTYLAEKHRLTDPTVIRLRQPPTLSSLLGIVTDLRTGETRVDVPSSALERLLVPRPMYLWRGQ